jgi:hypothetical protein
VTAILLPGVTAIAAVDDSTSPAPPPPARFPQPPPPPPPTTKTPDKEVTPAGTCQSQELTPIIFSVVMPPLVVTSVVQILVVLNVNGAVPPLVLKM